jgi:ribonuclease P protein component
VPRDRFCFPKSARLLKSAEYRRIYQEGRKFVGPLFAAFYRQAASGKPARVGYTTPRVIGKAVARNRIKRRLREAVRVELPSLGPGWEVVFNPRRALLQADSSRVTAEVARLFDLLRGKS